MTYLGSSDVEKLQTRPHNTKLWLSIYQPKTVFAGQINKTSAAKGDRVLTYDNPSGDYTKIKDGMTMFVGLTANSADKGKIRTRSSTSGTITVAENSHISWADNDYITVVDFFEINAVYPRIIQDPSDDESTLWYKDYDIVYTNQNSVLGSFVCMGSHFAGFLDDAGDCWIYFTSSGTSSLVGGTLSYFWDFSSGTPTSSSGTVSDTPGWVNYKIPGHYTTELVVSGSVGGVDKSYRHISIYDRPEKGGNNPILNWELSDLSGDRESGGYTATIRILQNVPQTYVRDGALVVIFADDWYNYEKVSIGGNQPTRENIVFSGYILNGSIRYNYQYSAIEFEVGSPTIVMQQSECFSVSITDCAGNPQTYYNSHQSEFPSPWTLVEDLGVQRGIYHYLKWHSTVNKCCDIRYYTDDRAIYAQDFDRASLYDAVNSLISGALLGRCVSDRQGTIWFEREIYVVPDSYSTGTSYYLTKRDWMDEPAIEERQTDEISYIEIGGVAYTQSVEDSTPLLAAFPGTAPGYRGGVERIQGLALLDQNELNTIGGYLYKYRNVRYPDISLKLSGNYRNADIAPQEKWHMLVNSTDTVRLDGIDIISFIKGVSFAYDPQDEILLTSVSLAELSTALTGDTLQIPVTPPPPTPPGPPTPPLPPGPIPTGTVVSPTGSATYYGIGYVCGYGNGTGTSGLYYTADFSPATGTVQVWQHVVLLDNIDSMFVDETTPDYVYFIEAGKVWRYIRGGSASVVLTDAQAEALAGAAGDIFKSVYVDSHNGYVYTGIRTDFLKSKILRSTDNGTTWAVLGTNLALSGFSGDISVAARSTYIWALNGAGGLACSANSGGTWIIYVGTAQGRTIFLDPITPSIAWVGGYGASAGKLHKYTYSGGSISQQDKTPVGITLVGSGGMGSVWINPSNPLHQRAYATDNDIRETFDGWSSYNEYLNIHSYTSVNENICQQRWSIDYDWGAVLTSENVFGVEAAPTVSGTYTLHNGASPVIAPYTNSVPISLLHTPTFGFWAGKAT